ncbi:MAG: MFS transporter [Candidatus Marinimicrobia bacterium]|nr:MFS transporter [Candidatus Neomarinimicrobiota bacterium]MCF7828045.1 MFS transporter [Candidatus Neomarinimicrobiota bacterium]MCF7879200.1 MFS transporter [Candidatus Neomarinimicrobiota bacterium]
MEQENITPEDYNQQHLTRIIIGIMLGVFLAGIDGTVVSTAMPTIVTELGGLAIYSWVFSAYMLTGAISMPIFGKLCDVIGIKINFFAAVVLFLAGSILSGLSANMMQLVLFRAVQGLGAGGMFSVPYALIGKVFPPERRGKALGYTSAVWGISSVLGPLLGSTIVTALTWRWVFYLNIPFGIGAIYMINRAYREVSLPDERQPIDYGGAFFLMVSILLLLLGFLRYGQRVPFWSWSVAGLLGSAVVAVLALIQVEKRAKDPILPLDFFSLPVFRLTNIIALLGGFTILGLISYVPLYVQASKGGSAMTAGIVIMPLSIGWSGASFITGRILHRTGGKKMIVAGMAMVLAGCLLALRMDESTPLAFIIGNMLVLGIGMGTQTPGLLVTLQNSIHISVMGVATASQQLARRIGATVGVSLMGAVLTKIFISGVAGAKESQTFGQLPESLKSQFGDPTSLLTGEARELLPADLLRPLLEAFSNSITGIFAVGVAAAALGLVLSFRIHQPESVEKPT